MMDIADLGGPLAHAQTGNLEPLARHIESGGPISAGMRAFLAAHLRDQLPKKRGNKRTFSQIEMEARILIELHMIQIFERVTANKALDIFLDRQPDLNRETVKGYLRKSKARRR